MQGNRKQAVSIRLGAGDIRKVKRLAERIGVRDSDVIRFALKWALSRVAPLCDPEITGASLVPMFVETAAELIRHFELDAFRLDAIVNADVEPSRRVAHDDIALLALAASQQPYALLRVKGSGGAPGSPGVGTSAGGGSIEALRQYLYDKYIYGDERRGEPDAPPAQDAGDAQARVVALVAS